MTRELFYTVATAETVMDGFREVTKDAFYAFIGPQNVELWNHNHRHICYADVTVKGSRVVIARYYETPEGTRYAIALGY